jgi:hypothetical protein
MRLIDRWRHWSTSRYSSAPLRIALHDALSLSQASTHSVKLAQSPPPTHTHTVVRSLTPCMHVCIYVWICVVRMGTSRHSIASTSSQLAQSHNLGRASSQLCGKGRRLCGHSSQRCAPRRGGGRQRWKRRRRRWAC